MKTVNDRLASFIEQWPEDDGDCRNLFVQLKNFLAEKPETRLEFQERPGITYSLRAVHAAQKKRPLFVMIDVIEDSPRWLSVCFYGEFVKDPEERGDYVPGGLLGEDGICFDVDKVSDELLAYLTERISEAHQTAAQE